MKHPFGMLPVMTVAMLFMMVSLSCAQTVKPGASVLIERNLDLLAGKRVGIICNQTSRLPDGKHLVDALLERKVNVTALFAPEHGIRGFAQAGEPVPADTDSVSGLPVHSLYGASRKPRADVLRSVDVLLLDLQDAGARYYTYASTMALAMQAAGEEGKLFIVLDRPNPINGLDVEGPVLDTSFRSFVGMFPIPVRHALTLGELATMISGEHWLPVSVNLRVIAMEGWHREMYYDQTGLPWIAPSPNLKTVATAIVYPGTCLFEGTNVSEGRGTPTPFEIVGAPWIDGKKIASRLNEGKLPGVHFRQVEFTPSGSGGSIPKHAGRVCGGVAVDVTDRGAFKPFLTAKFLLSSIQAEYPESLRFSAATFDRLAGTDEILSGLTSGRIPQTSAEIRTAALTSYLSIRSRYLLY